MADKDMVKFTGYPDGFRVSAPQSDIPLNITIYDLAGQRLAYYVGTTDEIRPALPNGIYIVDVVMSGSHQAFKWVRY
jgi:hypothetical protein